MPPKLDVMIDIETLSLAPTAAVIAIGAVKFDPLGLRYAHDNPMPEFFVPISVTQARHLGTADADTLRWWEEQPRDLRNLILGGVTAPTVALDLLFKFADGCVNAWAKSPNFDFVILQHLCKQLGRSWPFGHRTMQDVRTAEYAARIAGADIHYVDEATLALPRHHPLGDCYRQIYTVQKTWAHLNRPRSFFGRLFGG